MSAGRPAAVGGDDSVAGGAPGGRPFREADWSRVRALLVDIVVRGAPGSAWEVRRWDGWRWHQRAATWEPAWEQTARVWEDADGTLLAAAHTDGAGRVALQVDPSRRDLEAAMVAWAEAALAVPGPTGGRRLGTPVRDYDEPRQRLLEARGWHPTGEWSVTRWQRLRSRPVALAPIAAGYTARPLGRGDRADAERLATLLNAAFGRTFHAAEEHLVFEAHAPDYDPELHLVAATPDGSFAAHVGVTHEPVSRLAIVEPVCTHPDHRRRGLAEALIREGLERARQRGAIRACVDTGSGEAANRLYAAVGFGEVFPERTWEWRGP
jgi:predicted N-acetyltransferase YhbS